MTIESNKNKLPKARLGKLTIDELSIVDRPCVEPALVTMMKRQVTEQPTKIAKGQLYTNEVDGHAHAICVYEDGTFYVQYATSAGADNSHSHGIVYEDGKLVILADSGHSHELAEGQPGVVVVAADALVVVAARAPIGKSTPSIAAPIVNAHTEQSTMKTDAEKIAALETETSSLRKQLGLILKLSTTEHALWKSLDADVAAAFLAKSVNDRAPMVADFEKANGVEYTADDGTVYLKSENPKIISLAKRADEETRKRVDVEVAKRAADIFGNIAGTDAARTDLLKAIEREPDGTKREAMLGVIKSAAGAMKSIARAPGAGGQELPEGDSVTAKRAELKTAVEKFAKDNGGLQYELALLKALKSDANIRDLYEQVRN